MFLLLAVTGGRVIAQDVEQLLGFYTSISKVETITDSTFIVTAAVITHPTQAYDGTDIQLGDILYSRPVIVGDDCNRFAIDSIIYKFAGTIKVRVIEQQDNGQPATGINAFIRENSRGQAHWISDIGSPLNQCISGRLSARAQDYSWYAKDSLGNVVEVLDGDTVLLSSGGLLINTDNQFVDSLAIDGGLLQISLSGSDSVKAVDLSAYLDNTDAQSLSNSGKTGTSQSISISNGNTISFSIADSDSSTTNELINAVNLVGTVLQITDAGGTKTQDLASLQDGTGTDDQQITAFSITNNTLTITLEDGGSLSVDLSGYLDNTDTVNDADSVVGNELQTLIDGGSSGNNRTIGLSDGGGNVTFSVADTDSDSTNELNASLQIIGDSLKITDAGGVLGVSLAKYLDNRDTDRQGFNLTSINATTKQIGLDSTTSYFRLSAGNNITLDLVDSTITINAQTISVIDSATFANDSLTLYFGGDSIQVYLGFEFTDTNTDKQQIDSFFIDNDTIYLSIERDSTEALKIRLNKYLDNTDSQQLGVSKVGNIYTVTLDSSNSIQIDVTDSDNDSSNEFNTGLNLVGTTLQLTDGGGTLTQDLGGLQDGVGLDTSGYNKQFTITDDSLIITDGQTRLAVDLSVYRDSALGIDLVNDADSVIGNEIQTLLDNGRNGQDQSLLLTLGGGIVTFSVADNDADTTNELNTNLFISGDTLYIVDAGGSYAVDLSPYLDDTDTDEQGFVLSTISTTTEKIGLERTGTAVYLKEGDNIALQRSGETITISANVDAIFDTIYFDSLLYLIVDGDTITVPIQINERADTSGYNYSFTRTGDSLFIQDGQSTLSVYAPIGSGVDRADTSGYNKRFELIGDSLFIGDGDTTLSVDLSGFGGSSTDTSGYNLSLTRVGDSIYIQDGNGTLSIYAPIVEGLLGSAQDLVWYVKNESGTTIPKGKVVMAVGTDGNSGHILVDEMIGSNLAYQEFILGVTTDAIDNGGFGYVMERGKIRSINLTAYDNGDLLYIDPDNDGEFTDVMPDAGNLKQPIAFVVSDKSNGVLAVRVKTGEQLGQLHDVKVNGTLAAGNVIVYDGSIWKNQIQLDSQLLSFDTLTSVLSISNGNSVDLSSIGGDTTFISNITQIIGDTAQQSTRIDTIVINTIGGDTTIYIETDTNDVLYTGANGISISGSEIQLGGTMKKPWTTFIGQSGNENMVFGNMNNLYFDNNNNFIAGQNSTYIVADNQIRFAPLTGSNYSVNLNNGTESTAAFTDGIRFTGSQFAIQSMDFYLSGLTIDSALATDYVLTMDGTQIVKKSLESDIDNQKLTVGSLTGENQIPLTIENGNQVFIPIADPDADATNEIQSLSWSAGTGGNDVISLSDGGGSITITDNVNDADASTTNEKITDVSLVGTTLNITEGGVLISENLAGLQDGTGTDDQKIDQFQIIANSLYLSLEGDGEAAKTVSLAPYLDNTDDQTASEVAFTPTGTISSTNVQAAIAELDGDISGIGGGFGTVGTNQLAYGSADTLTSSSSLTWNNTNKTLAINESSPFGMLSIQQNGTTDLLRFQDENGNQLMTVDEIGRLYVYPNGGQDNTTSFLVNHSSGNPQIQMSTDGNGIMTIAQRDGSLGLPNRLTFIHTGDIDKNLTYFQGGKLGVNVGSDIDQDFDVNGDARLQGALFDSTNSSGTAGQVLTSNGANAWSWEDAGGGGGTDDQTIDVFNLSGTTLNLSLENDGQANKTVNLSGFLDNTDDQIIDLFSLSSNVLSISLEDDGQTAKTVDLSPYLDNTDNQKIDVFSLIGNNLTLSLENDNESNKIVSLAGYLDNTDDQTATEVTFTPTGSIAATDVQAAIAELDTTIPTSLDDLTDAVNDNINNNLFLVTSGGAYGASDDDNLGIGYQSLNSLNNTGGSSNIGIGVGALENTTSGNANTAVGNYSLNENTTGQWNVGLGINSLSALNSGNFNTAIGTSAGNNRSGSLALTSSSNSIFLGAGSRANDNGETNQIVIGYESTGKGSNTTMIGNTSTQETHLMGDLYLEGALFDSTGTSGTAGQVLTSNGANAWSWEDASGGGGTPTLTATYVGFGDGSNELTGSSDFTFDDATNELKVTGNFELNDNNSILIGQRVGDYETGTRYTTAIGYRAYSSSLATGGAQNSIYGAFSGQNLYGNYNSFFGAYSGYQMVFGNSNTFIGHAAGRYNISGSNISGGSHNTFLGYETRMLSNQNDNSIVIGSQAVGEGSNTTVIGNTSTTKTHLYGNLDLDDTILDGDDDTGTSGQFLSYDGVDLDWVDAPSASLAAGYIGFGSGSNELTGESDFTYNATTNSVNLTNAATATGTPEFYINSSTGSDNYTEFRIHNRLATGAARALLTVMNRNDESFNLTMTNDEYATSLDLDNAAFFVTPENNDMVFMTAGSLSGQRTSKIRFIPGGYQNAPILVLGVNNVGIGITNPTYPVHVGQNIKLDADLIDEDGSAGTAGQVLGVGVTGVEWQNPTDIGIVEYTDVAQDGSLGATETLDMEGIASKIFEFEVGGTSSTTLSFSNPVNGGMYICRLFGATGSTTVNFPANFKFASGTAVTSVSFSSSYIFKFYYNGTDYITY